MLVFIQWILWILLIFGLPSNCVTINKLGNREPYRPCTGASCVNPPIESTYIIASPEVNNITVEGIGLSDRTLIGIGTAFSCKNIEVQQFRSISSTGGVLEFTTNSLSINKELEDIGRQICVYDDINKWVATGFRLKVVWNCLLQGCSKIPFYDDMTEAEKWDRRGRANCCLRIVAPYNGQCVNGTRYGCCGGLAFDKLTEKCCNALTENIVWKYDVCGKPSSQAFRVITSYTSSRGVSLRGPHNNISASTYYNLLVQNLNRKENSFALTSSSINGTNIVMDIYCRSDVSIAAADGACRSLGYDASLLFNFTVSEPIQFIQMQNVRPYQCAPLQENCVSPSPSASEIQIQSISQLTGQNISFPILTIFGKGFPECMKIGIGESDSCKDPIPLIPIVNPELNVSCQPTNSSYFVYFFTEEHLSIQREVETFSRTICYMDNKYFSWRPTGFRLKVVWACSISGNNKCSSRPKLLPWYETETLCCYSSVLNFGQCVNPNTTTCCGSTIMNTKEDLCCSQSVAHKSMGCRCQFTNNCPANTPCVYSNVYSNEGLCRPLPASAPSVQGTGTTRLMTLTLSMLTSAFDSSSFISAIVQTINRGGLPCGPNNVKISKIYEGSTKVDFQITQVEEGKVELYETLLKNAVVDKNNIIQQLLPVTGELSIDYGNTKEEWYQMFWIWVLVGLGVILIVLCLCYLAYGSSKDQELDKKAHLKREKKDPLMLYDPQKNPLPEHVGVYLPGPVSVYSPHDIYDNPPYPDMNGYYLQSHHISSHSKALSPSPVPQEPYL